QFKDLGIPLPDFLKATTLDAIFPFLGGVDDSKPCSFTMIASTKVTPDKMGYFSLPSKDTATAAKQMQDNGAQPAVEGEKIYDLGQTVLRFGADRVWFGGTVPALQQADETRAAKQHADGKTLAALWFDLRETRRSQPEVLKKFVGDLRKNSEQK